MIYTDLFEFKFYHGYVHVCMYLFEIIILLFILVLLYAPCLYGNVEFVILWLSISVLVILFMFAVQCDTVIYSISL